MSLILLADFKEFIHMTEIYDDVLLQKIMDSTELDVANNILQQVLIETATTEYHDGDRTNTILLENGLVTAVASIKTDDDCDGTYENRLDPDDYVWYDNGIIQLHAGWFHAQKKLIEVVYTHGYVTATLPLDLKQTIMKVMANTYQKSRVVQENEEEHPLLFSQKEIDTGFKKYKQVSL